MTINHHILGHHIFRQIQISNDEKMPANHESLQQTTLFLGFPCSTPPFSGKRTIIEWDAAIHRNPPPFAAYWETVENREKRWSHVEFPYLEQVWICSKSRHLRNIIDLENLTGIRHSSGKSRGPWCPLSRWLCLRSWLYHMLTML